MVRLGFHDGGGCHLRGGFELQVLGEHRLLVGDSRRQLGSEPGNLHRRVSLGGGGEVGEPVVHLLRRQLPSLGRLDIVPQFLAQSLELEAPLGACLEVCR